MGWNRAGGKTMRYTGYLIIICALLLTACDTGGGQVDDQAASGLDPTAVPTAVPGENPALDELEAMLDEETNPDYPSVPLDPEATETEVFELPVPLPGTLVASATEDPEAGLIFDKITFVLKGGPQDVHTVIELVSDGNFTRDGVPGMTTPDVVLEIDTMIDQVNFFGMQNTFLGPPADENEYSYQMIVERAGASRMVNAQDGFTPNEILQLFGKISNLGNEPPPNR
jgi:hypothetical protein